MLCVSYARLLPGAPHRLMEDDVYEGKFIPAGTTIVDNVWCVTLFCDHFRQPVEVSKRAMLRNESVYPDPHTFNPGRFLKDGQINPDVKDPEQTAFGYGRRYFDLRWMLVLYSPG